MAQKDIVVLGIAIGAVILADTLHEKCGSARRWVDRRVLPLRWTLWTVLFLAVVLYGKYGSEYSSANFIYEIF